MKKRITAFVLFISIMMASLSALDLNISAASTLTISSPSNDEHVSKSDPPKLKWNKVSGASGYRVTVVNVDTGKDLVRNYWTTNKSYSLASLFDDTIGTNEYPLLKIWVGAMASKNDDPGLTSLSSDIIYIKACEAPEITVASASIITAYGANFYVTVNKNYGSAISDAGFYIGTSSDIDDAKLYSAKRYSESGVLNNGTMILKINNLEPDTKYYYWGYAENGVDETLSSRKSFTTKAAEGSLSVSTTSVDWDDGADNSQTVNVSYTGSYSYSVEYEVPSGVIGGGYNYEWLSVSQSGSSLILKPNRANFSDNDRTAYVTVTSNGKSKEIVVTQERCSESAPTLQLWRETQSNILNDGASFGSFDLPQNAIEVDIISKNIRKVYAQLLSSDGSLLGESTNLTKISFNTSSLGAGTYSIKVFASNSETDNDYWSQRPFDSMTVYFTLKKAGSNSTGNILADTALSLIGKSGEELGLAYNANENWCARFVAYCADLAGVSGEKSTFIPASMPTITITSSNYSDTFTTRNNASPIVLLNQGKGRIYYFYNSIIYNGAEWKGSETNQSFTFYMSGFDTVYDHDRTQCIPTPGDIIFFKKSDGSAWAHVGIVVDYNPSTQNIIFVDGNNNGNGAWLDGKTAAPGEEGSNKFTSSNSRYVNKLSINIFSTSVMAIARPYFLESDLIYTITFDGTDWEDGNCTPITKNKKYNEDLIIPNIHTTNGNKVFLGWAVYPDLNNPIYHPGDTYSKNQNECFYAVWGDRDIQNCPHLWAGYEKDESNHWITCSLCHELIFKAPHIWNEGKITKPATESETGIMVYTCTECTKTKDEVIPTTSHAHNWSTAYSSDDTHHWYTCSGCSEKKDVIVHLWDWGNVTKPATESETGIRTYTCAKCNRTKDEIIPVTGHTHNWSSDYNFNETHHWFICTGCDEKNDVVAHLWSSGTITQPATESQTGVISYSCVFCGYIKEEIIPKLESSTPKNDVNNDGDLDQTDAEAILQYITEQDVEVNEEAIDVNNDGTVNIRDAATLLLYLSGKIDSFN